MTRRRRLLPLLLGLSLLAVPAAARAQDLTGHGGPVRALAPLAGGARLASAGFDQAVILWDPAAGRALRVLRWHGGAVNALLALPGGALFASAGEDARIALWPAAAPPGEDRPLRVLEGHAEPVAALAPAGLEGGIASAGWDGTVRIWAADGAPGPVMTGHRGPVTGLAALAPDGRRLASAGFDGTIRLWGLDGGAEGVLAEFGVPQNTLLALPGGLLAAGGADGTIRLLDSAGGAVRALEAGSRPVVALAVSPDGRSLAAASLGGAVTLWSLPEGRLRRILDGPGLPVWSVAFAPDGRTLWTGGQDRVVRRWDAASGDPLGPLAPGGPEAEPPSVAEAARREPQGARVFRACAACHTLTAAQAASGEPMAGPSLHGLFGRRMGSLPGYPFSERLARGDITWTPETVAALFTEGPDVMTPGTRMPVQRVEEPGDLAALIRFLGIATR